MEDTLTVKDDGLPKHPIVIKVDTNTEIFRVEANGNIVWTLNEGEIVIDDKKLLALAFLDMVVNITQMKYDYSVLDPELWKEYQKFLDTRK